MLARLSIRDIVLIDQLELDFARGLTILTGETGAGKSILLDALSLALGGRGDGSLVRAGAAQGQVTAVFEPPRDHAVRALLAAQDLPDEGELILRRVQMADGRTRAYVNDQSVGAQTLRALAAGLVEIHGQHDERALLDAATHRALVDAYGALGPLVEKARAAHSALKACEAELTQASAEVAAREREADFARHAAEELSKLGVEPGEEEKLAAQRTTMMGAEKVAGDIRDALASLNGDSAILPMLLSITKRLQRRAPQAPDIIEPSVKALDEAMEALEVAAQSIEEAMRACAFDPRELERCEERLFALRGMGRKYNVAPDALPALAEKYAADLADLSDAHARVARGEQAQAAAQAAYAAAAKALSAARAKAAQDLSAAVNAELPPLKLARATFTAEVSTDERAVTPDGYDRVEFVVQTNPGARPGPMMKVASGGELSRFLLALKVTLAERETAPTLVFDEIDTGVGGAVADAIGQRLARLAARAQVLAVTHAPQVAARSQRHFKIVKDEVGAGVATRVVTLGAAERREEIARMLAGAEITREARAAAKSLIEKAG
jgi:DNA repair protein RecN (Recombination protein N)